MVSILQKQTLEIVIPKPVGEYYQPEELEYILETQKLGKSIIKRIQETLEAFYGLKEYYEHRFANLNASMQYQLPDDIKRDLVEIGIYSATVWSFGKSLDQLFVMFEILQNTFLDAIEGGKSDSNIFIDLTIKPYSSFAGILSISGVNLYGKVYIDDPWYISNLRISLMNLREGMMYHIIQVINMESQKLSLGQ